MTPHNLNILLGLSTVGFVVVSLLYMIHLHDTKWKLLSKDNKIRHLESELRHYSSLYFSGCACKKNHAHTVESGGDARDFEPVVEIALSDMTPPTP